MAKQGKPVQVPQSVLDELYRRGCNLDHARKQYQQAEHDVKDLLKQGHHAPDSGLYTLVVNPDGSLKVDVRQNN